MKAIVAVDQNWAIGNKGDQLVYIPEDLKMFRRETSGKIVIYGRKTLETFPNGKPLKNRVNIILSRSKDYQVEGAIVAHDTEELFRILETECADYAEEDRIVIGGASVYRMMLPYCREAIVTRIEKAFGETDVFFPNLDADENWVCAERGETQTYEDFTFHWDRYERK